MNNTRVIVAIPVQNVRRIRSTVMFEKRLPMQSLVIEQTEDVTVDTLKSKSTDLLADAKRARSKTKISCPSVASLGSLSFLTKFNVPIGAVIPMFGGFSARGILKGTLDYKALNMRDRLIQLSKGNPCVIEIANKLYIAMKTAADMNYLVGQPLVTVSSTGPTFGVFNPT